jgi:uncharacterized protein DUF6812
VSETRSGPERVRTQPVKVRVFVRNGTVIDGVAHVHAGAYQRRISDVLNVAPPNFLPITEVTYVDANGEPSTAPCVLVNTADIVMIDTGSDDLATATEQSTALPGSSV